MGGCARGAGFDSPDTDQCGRAGAEMRTDPHRCLGPLFGCVAGATPEYREDENEIELGFVASGGINIGTDCLRK